MLFVFDMCRKKLIAEHEVLYLEGHLWESACTLYYTSFMVTSFNFGVE